MKFQTVSQEIQWWIDTYGGERDALNIAIAKLNLSEAKNKALEQAIQDLIDIQS